MNKVANLISTWAFLSVTAVAHGGAQAPISPNRSAVPPQPLASALQVWAQRSGWQLMYDSELAVDQQSSGAPEGLHPMEALARILHGTGLGYQVLNNTTISIVPSDTASLGTRAYHVSLATTEHDPLPKSADNNASTTKLDDVVVSARRREENLQSVPIAVTAVSQENLQSNNVKSLENLQYLVPSMSLNVNVTGRNAVGVAIRGQGGDTNSGRLAAVAMYLNEVPTGSSGILLTGAPGLFFDLENIQVLKGPQGTLFGRNTTGGALLLQSARPTDEFGGRIQLGYGNYENREIDGWVNVPLVSDKLLARIAFTGNKREGLTHLLASPAHPNGVDTDDRDFWSVRGTSRYQPSEWFQNDTIVTYTEYSSNGSPALFVDFRNGAPAGVLFPTYPDYLAQQQALGIRTSVPIDTLIETSGKLVAMQNISDITFSDRLTLRNVLGYSEQRSGQAANDLDGSPLPVFGTGVPPTDPSKRETYSEEIQLLGKAFGERLDWIFGAFYLEQPEPGLIRNTNVTFGGATTTALHGSDKTKALYSQGTYDLANALAGLSFTAGVRYTWDDSWAEGGPAAGPFVATTQESSALTWTLGLEYQLSPDILMYLTSRRGYRAGGANGVDPAGNQNPDYGPEYVNDAELGIKSDWNLGDVYARTNVAVYIQKYSDIQVNQQTIAANGSPINIVGNAAKATVWGGEFEALFQLTKALEVGANFSYLHFEYDEFGAGVNPAPLLANRLSSRPPRKYGLSARYRLPTNVQFGAASIQANWNWQDDSVGLVNAPIDVEHGGAIPSFGLLNISADLNDIAGTPFYVSAFVTNLTDEEYVVGARSVYSTGLGFAIQRFGEPRMYGVRLGYHW